jgi:hypothetical protein
MPLLEITKTQKITATVALEESTAKQVDQYAAFLKVGADDVVNKALEYVFGKDREFQQFRESNSDAKAHSALRVKRSNGAVTSNKRERKPASATAN